MKKMITIYADEGKMLTNGEVYGTTVHLAENDDGADFYEITQEQYDEILRKEAEEHGVIHDADS